MSAHHGEWEDIRENVLNYDEEGGGEQDQVNTFVHWYLDRKGTEVDDRTLLPFMKFSFQLLCILNVIILYFKTF